MVVGLFFEGDGEIGMGALLTRRVFLPILGVEIYDARWPYLSLGRAAIVSLFHIFRGTLRPPPL